MALGADLQPNVILVQRKSAVWTAEHGLGVKAWAQFFQESFGILGTTICIVDQLLCRDCEGSSFREQLLEFCEETVIVGSLQVAPVDFGLAHVRSVMRYKAFQTSVAVICDVSLILFWAA